MARQELHQHVEVSDDNRTVAAAEVTSEGPGGTAWASLRAESGHITPGRRASLVDAVLGLPGVQESAHLSVVFPLGDGETLQRLQERCLDVRTHPAGASAIMEANLPSGGPAARRATTEVTPLGGIEAATASWTIGGQDDGCVLYQSARRVSQFRSVVLLAVGTARARRAGLPKAEPGAGSAGRGAAGVALIKYG